MIRHAMSLDDTISRLKRSNRQPRITQRLADSKKQEKELDDLQVDKLNTKESAEDSDYAASQKHVKRKPTELFYKLKDILAMDAKTLFNIFVEKIPLNGKFQYSCFIVGPYCRLIHTTSDDDDGDKFMTQHMIKHIRTLEKKSAKYPLHYSKKHFYPRLTTSEAMFKKKLTAKAPSNTSTNGIPAAIRINPPDPESLVDFPLFHESGEQEALLTAVALRRNTNADVAKPAARKNTRLNRRLITKQKNDIQKKQIEKNLIKHFEKQPKVVMETINIPGLPVIKEEHVTQEEFPQEKKKTQRYWSRRRKFRFNPKKPNVPEKKRKLDIPDVQEPQPKILEIKEEQHDEISEDTDGSTSSGSDSSDNENPTRKRQDKSTIITSQMDWMKSLPQFQQESENEPQLKKMRYVPSILRRSRNPQSSNQLSNIKIVSCVSLADPLSESTPPSSTNVSPPCSSAASVDGPTSDNDSSEEDATDDDIRSSDSSEWGSDKEQEENEQEQKKEIKEEVEQKEQKEDEAQLDSKRVRRKQTLTTKEDGLRVSDSIRGIFNDHEYYQLPESWMYGDQVITENTNEEIISSTRNQKMMSLKVKSNVEIKPLEEYQLLGPSSKKIQEAADPATKAKALKLIGELRFRRPKEVMVCTERLEKNGTSFIVQDFYCCEICGKKFSAPNSLYGHYRGHAGVKPFKCNVCGKTFTRSHSLTYHQMIHENKARFECQFCNRKFRHPTHYKEHLNRHTGIEPYKCADCPKRFRTRNTYRRHIMSKHNRKATSMPSALLGKVVRQTALETSSPTITV